MTERAALAYGVEEACCLARCSRTAMYREIRAGRLRAHKRGRRTIVLAEDLEKWLKSLPLKTTR